MKKLLAFLLLSLTATAQSYVWTYHTPSQPGYGATACWINSGAPSAYFVARSDLTLNAPYLGLSDWGVIAVGFLAANPTPLPTTVHDWFIDPSSLNYVFLGPGAYQDPTALVPAYRERWDFIDPHTNQPVQSDRLVFTTWMGPPNGVGFGFTVQALYLLGSGTVATQACQFQVLAGS